jgi:hypothetical protein
MGSCGVVLDTMILHYQRIWLKKSSFREMHFLKKMEIISPPPQFFFRLFIFFQIRRSENLIFVLYTYLRQIFLSSFIFFSGYLTNLSKGRDTFFFEVPLIQ